jgi:hypothetical protein
LANYLIDEIMRNAACSLENKFDAVTDITRYELYTVIINPKNYMILRDVILKNDFRTRDEDGNEIQLIDLL